MGRADMMSNDNDFIVIVSLLCMTVLFLFLIRLCLFVFIFSYRFRDLRLKVSMDVGMCIGKHYHMYINTYIFKEPLMYIHTFTSRFQLSSLCVVNCYWGQQRDVLWYKCIELLADSQK